MGFFEDFGDGGFGDGVVGVDKPKIFGMSVLIAEIFGGGSPGSFAI